MAYVHYSVKTSRVNTECTLCTRTILQIKQAGMTFFFFLINATQQDTILFFFFVTLPFNTSVISFWQPIFDRLASLWGKNASPRSMKHDIFFFLLFFSYRKHKQHMYKHRSGHNGWTSSPIWNDSSEKRKEKKWRRGLGIVRTVCHRTFSMTQRQWLSRRSRPSQQQA